MTKKIYHPSYRKICLTAATSLGALALSGVAQARDQNPETITINSQARPVVLMDDTTSKPAQMDNFFSSNSRMDLSNLSRTKIPGRYAVLIWLIVKTETGLPPFPQTAPLTIAQNPLAEQQAVTRALAASAAMRPDGDDAPDVVITDGFDNFLPVDQGGIRDTEPDISGVGQIVALKSFPNSGSTSSSRCTGTLINPRTVLYAAHCVNDDPANRYGTANGQIPTAVAFQSDAEFAVDQWRGRTGDPSQMLATNTGLHIYNIEHVWYDPRSFETGFLEADIALGTLETPAVGVPTWAMLFSPLSGPEHAIINGYGRFGSGSTGDSQSSDLRRRIAENVVSALMSINDRRQFIEGRTRGSLPQPLYMIDMDSPGGADDFDPAAGRFDFDPLKGPALPREGVGGSGDSGSALIIDQAFARKVIAGVLSGNTRFFGGRQPRKSYGALSYYQPLFLFWDAIVANNPYKYVGSLAGDGDWEDPEHWLQLMDPNYTVIRDGELVNALPGELGRGIDEPASLFGVLCTMQRVCTDITHDGGEDPGTGDGLIIEGGPGSRNFVPDNIVADPLNNIAPRYFDVTLSEAGTTDLSSAITIDRLAVNGPAGLDIGTAGDLTSLIDITQNGGRLNVDGMLTSMGDYAVLTGVLSGRGVVRAPFVTNIAGTISPGGDNSVGTLTIDGNLIMSSTSAYLLNIGSGGVSDLIRVTGNSSLGGLVMVAPISGYMPHNGDDFRIFTGEGPVTQMINGELTTNITTGFDGVLPISAILSGELSSVREVVTPDDPATPEDESVTFTHIDLAIIAGLYADVIDPASPVQTSYALIFDQNRPLEGQFADVYLQSDLMSREQVQALFESLAPVLETTRLRMAQSLMFDMDRFYRNRIKAVKNGGYGGTFSSIGNPLEMAATAGTYGSDTLVASAAASAVGQPGEQVREDSGLDSNWAVYLSGGYLDGRSAPMPAAITGGRSDRFDGFYIAGGLEYLPGDNMVLGVSGYYAELDGGSANGQRADSELWQGTVYGAMTMGGGISVDGRISAGRYSVFTRRDVAVGANAFTLESDDDSFALTAELGVSRPFDLKTLRLTPRISLNYTMVDFDDVEETGGGPALFIERDKYDSLQGRIGLEASAKPGKRLRPYIYADFVVDFLDQDNSFGANFVGGTGNLVPFQYSSHDREWVETGLGLTYDTGTFDITASVDTTVGRNDVQSQSYALTARMRF